MIALGLREQMTEDGVNVSVVLPGYIDTDISVPLRAPEGAAGTDRRTVRRLVGGHADDLAGPVRGEVRNRSAGACFVCSTKRTVMKGVQAAFAVDPAAGQ